MEIFTYYSEPSKIEVYAFCHAIPHSRKRDIILYANNFTPMFINRMLSGILLNHYRRYVADTVRCGYLLQEKTVVNRTMLRWSRNCRQISLYARMHFGRNFIASREVPYSPRLKLVKYFLAELVELRGLSVRRVQISSPYIYMYVCIYLYLRIQ